MAGKASTVSAYRLAFEEEHQTHGSRNKHRQRRLHQVKSLHNEGKYQQGDRQNIEWQKIFAKHIPKMGLISRSTRTSSKKTKL